MSANECDRLWPFRGISLTYNQAILFNTNTLAHSRYLTEINTLRSKAFLPNIQSFGAHAGISTRTLLHRKQHIKQQQTL